VSRENFDEDEDRLRAAFAAWNDRGVAGFTPFLAETVEWHDAPEAPDASVHRGLEKTSALLRNWEAGSGEMRVSLRVEEIVGAGDEYVVISRARITGETSGMSLPEHRWFHVVRLHDGKLSRVRVFLNREQALEAVGLPE
jgi:ketosteroid isomerase-like protein